MKKSLFVLLVAMVFAVSFSTGAMAKDMTGKFGIGADVFYNDVIDDEVDDAVDAELVYDGAVGFGVNASYFITKWLSAELGVSRTSTDMDMESIGVSVNMGELTQIPLAFTLRAHVPNESVFSPYAGVGAAYYFNEFDASGLLLSTMPPGASVDPDDGFGFFINGGVQAFVTDNVSIGLDMKYTWYKEDFVTTVPKFKGGTDSFDLDAFTLGIGVKYYF